MLSDPKKFVKVSLDAKAMAIPPTPSEAAIAFISIPSCENKNSITRRN